MPVGYLRISSAANVGELKFAGVPGPDVIAGPVRGLIDANNLADGMVYIQVSRRRRAAQHDRGAGLKPSVFAYVRPLDMPRPGDAAKVITVATIPDCRWERRDIKTTALVANVIARLSAQERGVDDAWLVQEAGGIRDRAIGLRRLDREERRDLDAA
jgi:D-alanine transaminase